MMIIAGTIFFLIGCVSAALGQDAMVIAFIIGGLIVMCAAEIKDAIKENQNE